MHRVDWRATICSVTKSWTQLSTHMHVYSQLVLVIGGIVLTLRTFNKIWDFKIYIYISKLLNYNDTSHSKKQTKNLLKH